MPLEIRPLQPSDALSWIRTRALAYYGPTHDILHNGLVSEESMRGVAEDRKHEIGSPNVWHWKIVDTDLTPGQDEPENNDGRIIAVAVWKLMNSENDTQVGAGNEASDGDSTSEHASIPAETEQTATGHNTRYKTFLPPELRVDALQSLFVPLDSARDEIMGIEKPFFMLNSLATHPDHQGRGAGKLLLDWGVKKADDEGLITYLDASQVARPIYERRGFEVKRAIEWDRTVWGGKGVDVHYCMVRLPHGRPKHDSALLVSKQPLDQDKAFAAL